MPPLLWLRFCCMHTMLFVKITHLMWLFEHIASQNLCIMRISIIFFWTRFIFKFFMQFPCLDNTKSFSNALLTLGKYLVHINSRTRYSHVTTGCNNCEFCFTCQFEDQLFDNIVHGLWSHLTYQVQNSNTITPWPA